MQGVTKRNSLYFQLIILLVISGAVALAVFYGLNTVGENVVYYYYNHSNYSAKREKNYVAELQSYVSSNELKSSDTDELSQWVTEKAVIISLWLYKDNALIFDSDYPDNATYSSEPAYLDENNGSRFYTIEFADGEVEVGISGVFDYQLYNYASFGEMLLAFSIFILMVLIGIRKKMEYIRKLSKEIQILEGGNLEYKITVTGKDELTALAGGLNCMRESFRRQTIQEAEIVRENQKIVTQMSHDIRTPLTSIMLYTELLKKGTYKNEEQFREYIEKIDICGPDRNSYSKTDKSATFMRIKTDYMGNDQLLPAYNVQIGVADEYIAVVDVNHYRSDMDCFIPLMKHFKQTYGFYPKYPVADAGYGSYNNYIFCEQNGMEKYMKFPMFKKETKERKYHEDPFRAVNFRIDEQGVMRCPNDKAFHLLYRRSVRGNQYGRKEELYECEDCSGCPYAEKCKKTAKNRTVRINQELTAMHQEVIENLESIHGALLRMNRSIQAEGTFGIMKNDRWYKRIVRRGINSVKLEVLLVAIGHNLYKYQNKKMRNRTAA